MNRLEFMGELEALLSDISTSEREEALTYYNEYFNDAGVENEQEVIASLGTPAKVATIIKDGLSDNEGKRGEFSENGFSGLGDDRKDEIAAKTLSSEERGFGKKQGLSGGMIALIIVLCIFGLPVLAPIFSVIFGIIVTIATILFTVAISGIALVIAGVAVFVAAFVALFTSPLVGISLLGCALVIGGVGILLTILGIWILTKVVPPMIRGIVSLCKKPFQKSEVK